MTEIMKFQAKVWKTGNSVVITIPVNVLNFEGWEVGDELKVMAKKV